MTIRNANQGERGFSARSAAATAAVEALERRLTCSGSPQYSAIDIGGIPGFENTVATGLNAQGLVVGYGEHFDDAPTDQAFAFQNGKLKAIEPPGSSANGVNAIGEIVGSRPSPAALHAFVIVNGKTRDFHARVVGVDDNPFFGTAADGVNDRGDIIGVVLTFQDEVPFFVDDAGRSLGGVTLQGLEDNLAYRDLSNSRFVVGQVGFTAGPHQAVIYHNGHSTRLGTLAGPISFDNPTTESDALAVNEAGWTVGYSSLTSGNQHAFLYADGKMRDLGSLHGGTDYSAATDINDQGIVVGSSGNDSSPTHAFVFRNGKMRDLNELASLPKNVVLNNAVAINRQGQILATAVVKGHVHSYLLTPKAPSGSVTGHVFADRNGDGVWSTAEHPLEGWQIYVDSNLNGKWDAGEQSTFTDAVGRYRLTGLEPGRQRVAMAPRSGWTPTRPSRPFFDLSVIANTTLGDRDFGVHFGA